MKHMMEYCMRHAMDQLMEHIMKSVAHLACLGLSHGMSYEAFHAPSSGLSLTKCLMEHLIEHLMECFMDYLIEHVVYIDHLTSSL